MQCYCFLIIGKDNPYKMAPSYTFWAPWIGRFSRGPITYNSELKKHPQFHQTNHNLENVDGDRLQELMCNASVRFPTNLNRCISQYLTMSEILGKCEKG